jgi:hypothetical protein
MTTVGAYGRAKIRNSGCRLSLCAALDKAIEAVVVINSLPDRN